MLNFVKYFFFGIFIFLLISCSKEEIFKKSPSGPTTDLTKGDCISCHTNADALLATLGSNSSTFSNYSSSGPIRKYSNNIQGDG